jgi:hypothetical protein
MSRVTTRQRNGFRYGDAFIQRWTTILCSAIVVLPMVGIGLGFWSDHDSAPDGMPTIAVVVMCAGFVIPLLAAAVLGGEAIARGGGLIGAMLTYGLLAGSAGHTLDIGWAFWTGLLAVALAVPGSGSSAGSRRFPCTSGCRGHMAASSGGRTRRPTRTSRPTTPV